MTVSWWSSWQQVGATAAASLAGYAFVLAAVRVAGRRTVSQMSAFDAVVTIALGSVLANTAVPPQPAIVDGLTAAGTLLAAQMVTGWFRQRSERLRRVLDFSPEVVARDGRLRLSRSPFSAQLAPEDVAGRLRRQGVADLGEAGVVVLEARGDLSVLDAGQAERVERALGRDG